MSLTKYLSAINKIDPGNIYAENIRSLLNVSLLKATLYCEVAVREKIFVKKFGVICPIHGQVIRSFDSKKEIPSTIICTICEGEEIESFEYATNKLSIVEFYKLNKP